MCIVYSAHNILVSPMDPIRSHFKSTYGLAVKLVEAKEMRDCQNLVEKSFGSFVVQERINRRWELTVMCFV